MSDSGTAKKRGGCMAASIFSLVVMASGTLAQGPPPGLGAPSNNNPKTADRQREVRESQLREAERRPAAADADQKRIAVIVAQVKEDFTRIQIVRNQIAHNLVARIPLNYLLVSTQTEEIHKRAQRLKGYMLEHPLDEKQKELKNLPALESREMIGALVDLCKLIDGFVENPAIKNAANIDVQQLEKAKKDKARADSDLVSIVELSSRIQKSAERLH